MGLFSFFKKHKEYCEYIDKLEKEHKYIDFAGNVIESPIGSYWHENDDNHGRLYNLYASKHDINFIKQLVSLDYFICLGNFDPYTLYREERGDKPIGIYQKNNDLFNIYEGDMEEIEQKGYQYVLFKKK
ncbi:hypothetical protein B5F77_08340 [Parabacteroides sp. An277]|uniref:hypothetical protein n=1 Tax=Parabacteroides sp. An277 TaxID=1965619 RepID=UPI000B391377|nr:hypothetical protein [Parabacteroides sp. An277]OUO52348.1 hypothetical protein B5F77_08340 [Parabacteroides sp. An277]